MYEIPIEKKILANQNRDQEKEEYKSKQEEDQKNKRKEDCNRKKKSRKQKTEIRKCMK